MLPPSTPTLSVFLLSILTPFLPTALAACNTPGYVPCPANSGSGSGSGSGNGGGGGGAAPIVPLPGSLGDGGFSDNNPIDGAAEDGIQGSDDDGGGDKKRSIEARQAGFCCRPSPVQCVIFNDGLPSCYVSFCVPQYLLPSFSSIANVLSSSNKETMN